VCLITTVAASIARSEDEDDSEEAALADGGDGNP
jgi:hypothetical protein